VVARSLRLSGKEKAQTEMARMTQCDRAGDWKRKAKAEGTPGSPAAVVTRLAPRQLELDRPQSMCAEMFKRFNHSLRKSPSLELIAKYLSHECDLAFSPLEPLPWVAHPATPSLRNDESRRIILLSRRCQARDIAQRRSPLGRRSDA
jgi:hypothetical protein